jgi:hypothetical protein
MYTYVGFEEGEGVEGQELERLGEDELTRGGGGRAVLPVLLLVFWGV